MDSYNSGVYQLVNYNNGRRYIGSTRVFRKRSHQHFGALRRNSHYSKDLQRDWNEFKGVGFKFEKLIICSPQNLLMYEQAALDANENLYNVSRYSDSNRGFKCSQEAKDKMSIAAKRNRNFTGHRHSEYSKLKISAAKKGVRQSLESVQKRKAAVAALPVPPARRKLNPSIILEIRKMLGDGRTQKSIGDYFGVSNSVISEIKTGKAYKWVK